MKKTTFSVQPLVLFLTLFFCLNLAYSQVGIGTTNPNNDALLELDASVQVGGLLLPRVALTATANAAPLSAHVQGMTVYNTATAGDVTPGQYYNDGGQWVRLGGAAPTTTQIVSNTLTEDVEILKNSPGPQPGAYADVPLAGGGSFGVTFTATQPEALVMLSSSGYGYTNSMAYVTMRVMNGATSIGGTMNKIQSYDDFTGTITPWSLSFSKMITGLVVGNSYTLTVEAFAEGILGTENAVIQPVTFPDQNHLTLTVFQQ